MTPEERDAKEEFRPVIGYEGHYDVSSLGRVFSLTFHGKPRRRAVILKAGAHPTTGYWSVCLSGSGRRKTLPVHRLVLEAFAGPCPDGHEASHENGDRSDNRVSNLRWRPRDVNAQMRRLHGTALLGERNPQAKLTEAQVAEIRDRAAVTGETFTAIAKDYGVHRSIIAGIIKGDRWTR